MKKQIKEIIKNLKNKFLKENSEEKYQVKLRKLIDSYKNINTPDEVEKFIEDTKKLQYKLGKKREIK